MRQQLVCALADAEVQRTDTDKGREVADSLRATLSAAEAANAALRTELARAQSENCDLNERLAAANKSKHRAKSELAVALVRRHQLESFRVLFEHGLKPGGIYFIEDIESPQRERH